MILGKTIEFFLLSGKPKKPFT